MPLLELDHVTKRFGRVVIAEDLSFAVDAGDTVGIVGPNGAGKTSLFGLISGDLAPGAGQVSFAGKNVTRLDPAARCRLGLLARKRLEIARALATGPQLLLLDEVAGGLTDPEVTVLVEIIRGINAEGVAVIWIEHVVRALTSLVSRMTCLYGGEFIGDGTAAEVFANPRVREVYLGSDIDSSVVQAGMESGPEQESKS